MRQHADNLVERLCSHGGGDLIADLCRPYPIPVICRLLGADDRDWQLFDRWADIIFSALDADIEAVLSRLGDVTVAQRELDGYINRLIDEQSGSSREGLIGDLVSDHEQDDRLDRNELVAMVEAVLLAGTDTTRNQLGATLAVLGDHPEQYAALRHDRTLIPAAIEESLRYIGACLLYTSPSPRD